MGTPQYPLYKFAYDFCIKHQPFSDEFKSAFDHYKAEKEILRANKDVQIIKSYSLAKDSELIESIEKLKESINNRYIPCSAYTGLASHLIAIKYNLHFEGIDQLLELMIERVKFEKESGEIEESLYSYSGCYLESQEMKDEFCNFLKKMKTTLIAKKEIHCARITNSEQLSIIIKKVKENMQTLLSNKDGFSTHINFNSMIDYIESSTCSPFDIFSIRMLFSQLYSNITNISDYKSTDLPVLKTIKHRIDTLLKNNFDGKKTTELQLKGFATNLKELIKAFDC